MSAETPEQRLKRVVAELRKPFIVVWAYHSSDLAQELGFPDTGCWYVSARVESNLDVPRRCVSRGYSRKRDVEAKAQRLLNSKPKS